MAHHGWWGYQHDIKISNPTAVGAATALWLLFRFMAVKNKPASDEKIFKLELLLF